MEDKQLSGSRCQGEENPRAHNNPRKDGVVISIDEKGTMTVKHYGGSSWRVEAPKISDRQEIRGKADFAAAYAPHIAKIFYRFSPKKRAYHITGLLRQVRASIPKPMSSTSSWTTITCTHLGL